MTTATATPASEPKQRKTRRRGNGEGSIFQRADGRWVASVTIGFNEVGKCQRKTVYGWTKKEVQDKLTALQSRKLDGTLGDAGRQTVAEFLNRWLEDAARPTIRRSTFAGYSRMVKKKINPKLGGIALAKLTPAHVQGLYAALERDGASPYVRLLCHAVFRRAMKQAVRWGLVPRNVCDAVDPPRLDRRDIKPLDTDQVSAMLKAAKGDRLEALYMLAVMTGLRLGELFGLQWPDLDLSGGALTVRHTLTEVSGKLTLDEPKTDKSRRRVELPKMAVNALHEHRKRMVAAGHAGCAYVFCNKSGGPLRRSHFHSESFKPLLKSAELPDIRFHDLRHTAATLLLAEGVHPKIVQERLGHSQISVTLDIYSHVLPTMQKEAAGKLDRLFAVAGA
jgi:integrase